MDIFNTKFLVDRVIDGEDFGVGELAFDAENVGVALREFAVATLLWLVGAEDILDLVAAEAFT